MSHQQLRIRDFGCGVRLALTLLALTVLAGSGVSGYFMKIHHDGRDEVDGFTIDDIRAHYHGIQSRAPMLKALNNHHPADLNDTSRHALIDWLGSNTLKEDYDNFDLGDMAPETIIAENCVSCHSSDASGEDAYPKMSLRYFDEVMSVSVSRKINPMNEKVMYQSLHAHSLGLASLTIVTVLLLAWTRVPRPIAGFIAFITALGLLIDLGMWVGTRYWEPGVYLIVGGGLMYQVGVVLSLLIVIADLWLPKFTKAND